MVERKKDVNFVYVLKGFNGVVEVKNHVGEDLPESRAIKNEYRLELPEQIEDMCQYVKSFGGRALVVGGCVRDVVINAELGEKIKSKDYDLEVYGLEPDILYEILERKYGYIGIEGIKYRILKVKVPGIHGRIDVSVPRTDKSVGAGHKDFEIIGNVGMSISEAAARRDVTVNTMAYDPISKTVFDPHFGIEDIKRRMLRATDAEALQEDPLRVVRLVQLAARLGFTLDQQTFELGRQMVDKGQLDLEPKERWTEELQKLFLKSKCPADGLRIADKLGIVDRYWPELARLKGLPQQPEWHPEGDVWEHTLQVVDAAAAIRDRENMEGDEALGFMLGALTHDLGKALKTSIKRSSGEIVPYEPNMIIGTGDKIISHGHEMAGKEPAKEFFSRFIFPTNSVNKALCLVTNHMQPKALWLNTEKGDQMDGSMRKLAKRLEPAGITLRHLALIAEADQRGRNGNGVEALQVEQVAELAEWKSWYLAKAEQLKVLDCAPVPILKGHDVVNRWPHIRPDAWVGQILRKVQELQYDGMVVNLDQALVAADQVFAGLEIE